MLRDLLADGGVLLAPSCEDGWFGGTWLLGLRARAVEGASTFASVARVLEAVFWGGGDEATVAVLPYDGAPSAFVVERLEPVTPDVLGPALSGGDPLLDEAAFDLDGAAFRAAVERLQERIRAGDVYVANLTARLTGRLACDVPAGFSTLHARGAGAMSALVATPGGLVLASVSPERFVRLRDVGDALALEVWPIKGTRPRGRTRAQDAALARALSRDTKERAEHAMIVDLERNDVGRVAVPGSVAVRPSTSVVPTPYCWQMVSAVRGLVAHRTPLASVLESLFPCGSVTGAPKRAAMRIIAGLEATPRGAYCGSLVVARRGEIDSSVLIRTLEVRPDGSAAWGAGCGVTIESDPAGEWRETVLKAAPVLGSAAAVLGGEAVRSA
ncbi:MAG: anthranilate synthase component I family protein [Anaerosomatales bacterium]|nr:anthranilate synthase component I family protein [Anaerosomatales bacterium]